MWTLIKKFFTSEYTGLTMVIVVLALCISVHARVISDLKDAHEKEVTALKAQIAQKEEMNEKLKAGMDLLDEELRRANDLASRRGSDLERLRNANSSLQRKLRTSAKPNDKALARCSELLTEGAELVTEGEGLLLRHSAEHDALTIVVK
jgi:predicted RNase H-like nuclease (RuvC/YqgF family)